MTRARRSWAVMALGLALAASCGKTSSEQNIAGTWSATETYGADILYSTWIVTQSGEQLGVSASRPGGSAATGSGSISGGRVTLVHGCFSAGCGSCSYTFTGTAESENKMSGQVVYCPEDPALVRRGEWTAAKLAASRSGF